MFFVKLGRILIILAVWIVCLSQLSCESSNANNPSCFEDDCEVSCKTKGFAGGSCADLICECQDQDAPSYEWIEDTGSDPDAGSP